mgnify:CR=1 FL=1
MRSPACLAPHSMQKTLSLRGRKAPVAIRNTPCTSPKPFVGAAPHIVPPPVLLVTLRRGDPCGRPQAGQSPAPTHNKETAASGGQGRPPLQNPIGKRCVGADAHIGPPHRTPCKNPCHCEPVTDSLLWQSASPVPKTTALLATFPYSLKFPSLPHSSHFFHIFPVAKYCPTPYNKLCNRFVTFPHKKPVFLIERNL